MATYPGQIDTVYLLIQVEETYTTGGTGTFAHPVLINESRSFTQKASTQATVLPRTDVPDNPGQTIRITTALDAEITGSGICDTATAKVYFDMVGGLRNIKVQVGGTTGTLTVTGAYILEEFAVTGQKHGDLVTVQLKFAQSGTAASSVHA